ncbi:hypothetical protein [Agrobacterium tumefaciens]|uniref:hypothetical protein n=1 Tax=Agrobacterium tumefaciens TaxID=358 RepID=UPI003BA31343
MPTIKKATGLTPTEQHLAKLADDTFLDLWSWPNVFKKPGKELCDLLVVCGDDVLMFSDKAISWPDAPFQTAWSRWYNKAIADSADQIRKADLWLKKSPKAVFADGKCQQPIPIELPPISQRRVHGICVATGAEEAASQYFNDPDGTFMIFPHLKGSDHANFAALGHEPFCIGDVDPDGPFVHVFNMATLGIVMAEFDTITDFTRYLNARAELIRSQRLTLAPSEAEMVANYLLTIEPSGEHRFPVGTDIPGHSADPDMGLQFVQGEYAFLARSPEYRRRREANRISYEWDRLIGFFTREVLNGTQYSILDTEPSVELAERALRIMAREDRLQRRVLASAIIGARRALEEQKADRFARIAVSTDRTTGEKIAYVFVVLAGADKMEQTVYRQARAAMLQAYCLATLHDDRDIKLCVGIAITAISDKGDSEDLIVYPQQDWTPEFIEELRAAREQFEILQNPTALTRAPIIATTFPPDPAFEGMSRQQRRALERQRAKQERQTTRRR